MAISSQTVESRLSRASLQKVLSRIPVDAVNSQEVKRLLKNASDSLLFRIKAAFIAKSNGGTDEAGERWAPLKAATIAYSRTVSQRGKREKRRSNQPSQALTIKQQNRWWELYRQGLAIYKGDKASAAKRAWMISKNEGATTLLSKYGSRKVNILRKTDTLFNSITSTVTAQGEIVIRADCDYAGVHHNGSPSKGIPQRRLWPPPRKWPASWWNLVTDQIRQGIVNLIAQRAKG